MIMVIIINEDVYDSGDDDVGVMMMMIKKIIYVMISL
jgi:hypothetical protein